MSPHWPDHSPEEARRVDGVQVTHTRGSFEVKVPLGDGEHYRFFIQAAEIEAVCTQVDQMMPLPRWWWELWTTKRSAAPTGEA